METRKTKHPYDQQAIDRWNHEQQDLSATIESYEIELRALEAELSTLVTKQTTAQKLLTDVDVKIKNINLALEMFSLKSEIPELQKSLAEQEVNLGLWRSKLESSNTYLALHQTKIAVTENKLTIHDIKKAIAELESSPDKENNSEYMQQLAVLHGRLLAFPPHEQQPAWPHEPLAILDMLKSLRETEQSLINAHQALAIKFDEKKEHYYATKTLLMAQITRLNNLPKSEFNNYQSTMPLNELLLQLQPEREKLAPVVAAATTLVTQQKAKIAETRHKQLEAQANLNELLHNDFLIHLREKPFFLLNLLERDLRRTIHWFNNAYPDQASNTTRLFLINLQQLLALTPQDKKTDEARTHYYQLLGFLWTCGQLDHSDLYHRFTRILDNSPLNPTISCAAYAALLNANKVEFVTEKTLWAAETTNYQEAKQQLQTAMQSFSAAHANATAFIATVRELQTQIELQVQGLYSNKQGRLRFYTLILAKTAELLNHPNNPQHRASFQQLTTYAQSMSSPIKKIAGMMLSLLGAIGLATTTFFWLSRFEMKLPMLFSLGLLLTTKLETAPALLISGMSVFLCASGLGLFSQRLTRDLTNQITAVNEQVKQPTFST